jgi:hypothetical protein|tara:strand:- start:35 stop:439 length:405 start_codon:yes stop_codon:yes gene_type:complete
MRVTRIKISSNRSFGLVFFVVFLLVSLWPLTDEGLLTEKIKVVPLFISVVFLILGLLNSKLLTPLNKLWFKFGITLGNIVAPIVMGIIYFLVVTPTGLIMKIIGKDLLNKKYDKNKKTYWILRDKKITLMKKQF